MYDADARAFVYEKEKKENWVMSAYSRTKTAVIMMSLALMSVSAGLGQTVRDGDLSNSIVQVVVHINNQFVPQGTAFVIRKNDEESLLATAFHVYAAAVKMISDARGGALEVRRVSRAGTMISSTVDIAGSDPEFDLIVFRLRNTQRWTSVGNLVPLPLSDRSTLTLPMHAQTVGYFGSDNFPTYLRCEVSGTGTVSLGAPRADVEELLVSGLLLPGHSGSPLLGDDGAVLGIVSSIVPTSLPFNPSQLAHSGLAKAAKVEHLNTILNSIGSR